jgi:hypothetical protein
MFSTVRVTKLVKRAQPEVMEIDVLHSHDTTQHAIQFHAHRCLQGKRGVQYLHCWSW